MSFPKIMGHCHLFPTPPGQEQSDEYGVRGTTEHLSAFLEACGFDQAQALAPHGSYADASVKAKVGPGVDGLDWLFEQAHVGVEADSLLLATATIRPDLPDAVEKLREAQRRGVRMLKFHPLIMQCDPLVEACVPYFRAAEEARMSMVYHTGSGGWNWHDRHGHPDVCAELARRFPELPILMAHCGTFGGMDGFDAAVYGCRRFSSLYLETTATLLRVGPDAYKRAVDEVGPDRIVYGNDYPFLDRDRVDQEMGRIDALFPDEEAKDLVLGGNLFRLWQEACPERRA